MNEHPSPHPAAAPIRVANLVGYQAGAIVSRQVVHKPTGTVTVFAFDAGEGLSEHTAPFDALVHVIDGSADITLAGQTHRLAAGEMLVLPAGQPHAVQAATRFKMMLTMIRS